MHLRSHFIGILVSMVLLGALTANGQSPLYFSNLGNESGLPSTNVSAIAQDSAGFIWIGTQDGLCRFDGYKMRLFKRHSKDNALVSDRISCLLADADTLWIGTWEGLCKINTQTLAISVVIPMQNKAVRCLLKDTDDQLWIGTNNGLFVYNRQQNQYQYYTTQNSKLSHNTIRTLYQTRNGDVWIGTYDRLNRFRDGVFEPIDLKQDYKPFLKNNLILTIKPASATADSLLWIGTETGLCHFNTRTLHSKTFNAQNTSLSNEVVKCLSIRGSTAWLGTDFGLNLLNLETGQVNSYFHNPMVNYSLANNAVWDIFQDKQQNLWLITSNGISIYNYQERFFDIHEVFYQNHQVQAGNQIRSLLIDNDQNLWLATIHGIIVQNKKGPTQHFNTQGPASQKLLLDNAFALAKDPHGQIWIGTAGGINIWQPKKNQMKAISTGSGNGLQSNYINGFAITDSTTIWVSAWEGGLFKASGNLANPETLRFHPIENKPIEHLAVVGTTLIFSTNYEIWALNTTTMVKQPLTGVQTALNGKNIRCLKPDSLGTIWIGSDNLLLSYNPKTGQVNPYAFESYGETQILSIEPDNKGNLFISTQNAIIKLMPQSGQKVKMPLPANSPLKGFYVQCSYHAPNGQLFFGGDNGFVILNPQTHNLVAPTSGVVISELYINNRLMSLPIYHNALTTDIAYTRHITLNHKNNSLTFEFSTLDFWIPAKSSFRYRLLGFETDWSFTLPNQNLAVYSNLPPGKYQLQVQGFNYLGINTKEIKTLDIVITPPIWKTKFFLLAYFIALTGLTYLGLYVYNYRQKVSNELKIARLEKEHSEALNQAKLKFFTNISHEFRTPLSLIAPPINQVLEKGTIDAQSQQMLKLAGKNAQRLLKLVNQLLDFSKMERTTLSLNPTANEIVLFCQNIFNAFSDLASRNEIDYKLVTPPDAIYAKIDAEKVETILFNLLSNAFKYTPVGGAITLELAYSDNRLTLKVHDNGHGIADHELANLFTRFYQTQSGKLTNIGTGIGLSLSAEYAKLHGGTLTVQSQLQQGSCFTLEISAPLCNGSETDAPLANVAPFASPETTMAQSTPPQKNRRTILVVDDNQDILDYVTMNLNREFNIIQALNGKQGFELAKTQIPDMVVSDVMMPELDGLTLCKQLRQTPQTQTIPVILLTAKSLDAQKAEGMDSGANLYITKPFDIGYLKACIANVFAREEQLRLYIKTSLITQPATEANLQLNQNEIFLKKVMTFIERNLDNPDLSVELIARHLNMSDTQLYRRFKAITNQSTKDIIKHYRLNKAAAMLGNNEGNVTEVMYAVGFSSLSSFSKSFKEQFGLLPTEYLKQKPK